MADAFGGVVGSVGIVIALAAVIGKCLMDSGASDRIVRSFLKFLGGKRASWALMGSGFVMSIPVFFDTVFYLLIPLARSLFRRTGKNYVLYITAIAGGAIVAHTLVPPTPGPLFMANELGIDLGVMIGVGLLVGLPVSILGLAVCWLINKFVHIPMRPYEGQEEPEPLDESKLPSLGISLLPILLPVLMISANTIGKTLAARNEAWKGFADVTALLGNPSLALLCSAVIAMFLLARNRGLSLKELAKTTETALMSGGVIILITAAGGAFGAMLREAGIQDWLKVQIGDGSQATGVMLLLAAFVSAAVVKFAQGSGTVSMITTASIFGSLGVSAEILGFNPVYLAIAIGNGALVGDWMNNSGFWIFAKMSVLTEAETLKTWTILTATLGFIGLSVTVILSQVMPLLK